MAVAVYAALSSLSHTIDRPQTNHSRPPISLDKSHTKPLTESLTFLLGFLEHYPFDQIQAHGKNLVFDVDLLCQPQHKVIEEMDLIKNEETKYAKVCRGRRYLIVMDDIWSIEAWYNRSRILITTRSSNLASQLSGCCGLEMSFLDDNIFYKSGFGEEGCSSKLEEMGKKIVECCKGLKEIEMSYCTEFPMISARCIMQVPIRSLAVLLCTTTLKIVN
ncbi:NBS-LRR class disease resistance protein [Striga asiatica]|uniref:NBS-LRR class disease resistance protein n=1 Tax=Striga asiatica TaxID=4170 RepID=A0A5A7R8B5_STRAF|nr:NBS-LRR class disease resistance protein [Striga asiatica]